MNSAQAGISLFLLLFTYVCGQITEIQRDTRIFAFNVNSNLSYVGHEFRNHQISNFSTKFFATQCAMECHRTPRCQSFNFASKTRQCQLNDATHDDFPDDLANDSSTTGVMYYLKDAITISSVSWKFHVWILNNFLLVLGKQSITVAMQHVYMICSRDYLFSVCLYEIEFVISKYELIEICLCSFFSPNIVLSGVGTISSLVK